MRDQIAFRAVSADADARWPTLRVVPPDLKEVTVTTIVNAETGRVQVIVDSFEEAERIEVYLGSRTLWKVGPE